LGDVAEFHACSSWDLNGLALYGAGETVFIVCCASRIGDYRVTFQSHWVKRFSFLLSEGWHESAKGPATPLPTRLQG
jgi:hypothetical protein